MDNQIMFRWIGFGPPNGAMSCRVEPKAGSNSGLASHGQLEVASGRVYGPDAVATAARPAAAGQRHIAPASAVRVGAPLQAVVQQDPRPSGRAEDQRLPGGGHGLGLLCGLPLRHPDVRPGLRRRRWWRGLSFGGDGSAPRHRVARRRADRVGVVRAARAGSCFDLPTPVSLAFTRVSFST